MRSITPLVMALLSVAVTAGAGRQTRAERVARQPESAVVLRTIHAERGDLIIGTLVPSDDEVTLEAADSAGRRVRMLSSTARTGFVAPVSGSYVVRLIGGATGRTYAFTTEPPSAPRERMRGVHVVPREVQQSARLLGLTKELGTPGAVERFWAEIARMKGILIEPLAGDEQHLLVTFFWRATYETFNVLLNWPVAWDRPDDYYMSNVAGTDIWYKTLRLRRGSRFSYTLSPNDRGADRAFTNQPDPLNPGSILETAGAPDDQWFRRAPATPGRVDERTFESSRLNGPRTIYIYTAAGFTRRERHPLVLLFDGSNYTGDAIGAPNTFDNLIASGRIRAPVVCFFGNARGSGDLGVLNERFSDAIALELMPWLRREYSISSDPADVVIGGYSGSAVKASLIALRHPLVFGNVLSQSGSFRQQVAGMMEPNYAARRFAESERVRVRFYLDVGLYEPAGGGPGRPLDELILGQSNTAGNRHLRDVLLAKGYEVIYRETGGAHEGVHWRATLAEALVALLKPRR